MSAVTKARLLYSVDRDRRYSNSNVLDFFCFSGSCKGYRNFL